MKFANTNQLGQVVSVASAVKNIHERLAREKDPCVRARLVLVTHLPTPSSMPRCCT